MGRGAIMLVVVLAGGTAAAQPAPHAPAGRGGGYFDLAFLYGYGEHPDGDGGVDRENLGLGIGAGIRFDGTPVYRIGAAFDVLEHSVAPFGAELDVEWPIGGETSALSAGPRVALAGRERGDSLVLVGAAGVRLRYAGVVVLGVDVMASRDRTREIVGRAGLQGGSAGVVAAGLVVIGLVLLASISPVD